MRIGVFAPLANPVADADYIRLLGELVDELGFHSLWAAEHVVLFDDYASQYPYSSDGRIPAGGESGLLEPFTTLAYLAAVTKRVRLGTGICLVPQRNPVYTAKEAANVDYLSGGRLDFGVGVGWLAEEFRAVAESFERRRVPTLVRPQARQRGQSLIRTTQRAVRAISSWTIRRRLAGSSDL